MPMSFLKKRPSNSFQVESGTIGFPLKKDALDTTNAKLFYSHNPEEMQLKHGSKKMLDKNFIQRSNSRYGHSMFTVPKKDGTF